MAKSQPELQNNDFIFWVTFTRGCASKLQFGVKINNTFDIHVKCKYEPIMFIIVPLLR